VLDVRIWGTGLVALTGQLQLIAVTNLDEPRPRQLADPQLDARPTSWTLVEPRHTLSLNVEVFIATTSGTILVVDAEGVKDQLLSYGPFTNMVVSPSGQTLACITQNGEVHVCLTDFSKDLYQFPTQTSHMPIMAWYVSYVFYFYFLFYIFYFIYFIFFYFFLFFNYYFNAIT
jgi:vacuolar protein sorting-associated protein 16